MKLFTRENAEKTDKYLLEEVGFTLDILVEHAAMAVANACEEIFSCGKFEGLTKKVDIFAGKGNNGLDAYSCARILHARGFDITLWEIFDDYIKNPKKTPVQRKMCSNLGIGLRLASEYIPGKNRITIDGIFGTAFNFEKGITEDMNTVFENINNAKKQNSPIIAIDIPSGVDADTGRVCDSAICADITVTFMKPKVGLLSYPGREYAGKIFIDNIGIPLSLINRSFDLQKSEILFETPDIDYVRQKLPSRDPKGHKGTFGTIGVVGGSCGMAGAPCLSSMAALKSGCGLVYMAVPKSIAGDCLKVVPEALVSSDYDSILKKCDVVVIGPGMESTSLNEKFIRLAIKTFPKLILDAGAISIISKNVESFTKNFKERYEKGLPPVIITPHPGEMKRLIPAVEIENRVETAVFAANQFKSVFVYKGAGTVTADANGKVFINSTGDNSLAKGGSGDVLAGIIAALFARSKSAVESAAIGVYAHGLAGDISKSELGQHSVLPRDVIDAIPKVYKKILQGEKNQCTTFF